MRQCQWQEVICEEVSVNVADYPSCWQQGREEGGENMEWVSFSEGCVAPSIQEMRLGGVIMWPC